MTTHNPYYDIAAGYAQLLNEGAGLTADGVSAPAHPALPQTAPKALLFSPHPDDECITAGLPLRLLREQNVRIVNVAVTLGSRKDRRAGRLQELEKACDYLGFELLLPNDDGLESVNPTTREQDPTHWAESVAAIAEILRVQRPEIVFLPHSADWNKTHLGVHHLVLDALATLPADFACTFVETEFWGAMATPNLLIESSVDDIADMVAALALHVGEVARNPYHLRLPAWLMDNVRRGAEVVGGQGRDAPDFAFATLYRISRWADGRLHQSDGAGAALSCHDDLKPLFF